MRFVLVALVVSTAAHAEDHPCAPIPPAGVEARPGESGIYLAVGEAEEAAGELGTAARAYREALRHDPGHARARARFDALCELLRPPAPTWPRWGLLLVSEVEVDSNVALLPTDAPPSSMLADPEADGAVALVAQATFRPRDEILLALAASLRKQLRIDEFDRLSGSARASWRLRLGSAALGLRYAATIDSLGGALAGIRQEGEVALGAGPWRAAYQLVGRLDQLDDTRGFRGLEHWLSVGALARRGGLAVYAEAAGSRAQTREPLFRHWELGARLAARGQATSRIWLGGEARLGWSRFDEIDIDGEERRDVRLDLAAELELTLSARFALLAGVEGAWNWSTVADFDYTQLTASAGIAFHWESR